MNNELRFITANPDTISAAENKVIALVTGKTTVIIDFPITSGVWRCDLRYHNGGAGTRLLIL